MKKSDKKYAGEYYVSPSASKFSDSGVEYIGKWYFFKNDEKTVKRAKIFLFVFSLLAMVLFALGGLIDGRAAFTAYVFLPFIIMFLPLALEIGCTVSVMKFGEKLTHKQYDKKITGQKNYLYACAVFSALTLIANIIMYFSDKPENMGRDIIFTLCSLGIFILTLLSLKMLKKLECSPEG